MTNQEAITKLTNIMHDDHYSWSPAILTAFNMAVDALRGADWDCISRERLKESLLSEDYETHDYCFPCKEIMKRIDEQPSAQPTHNNTSNALKSLDCIDRQAALDALKRAEALTRAFGYHYVIDTIQELPSAQPLVIHCTDCEDWLERQSISGFAISELPPAQPERTCVNCGRTVNNGGWYADGRTRCPIEEHYALPKDGYCHLWEKRNVTDDDYPERREE